VAAVRLDALQHNARAVRAMLGDAATAPGIMAVVKANAYGHGAAPAGLALEAAGVQWLACADIEEGIALRRAGVTLPVLVFGALSVSDLAGIFEFGLTPTVSTPAAARALEEAAASRGVVVDCHLKIDTGMNRLGFRHDNLGRTMPAVLASPHLRFTAVYSHCATADEPESPFFDEQRGAFDRACAHLGAMGLRGIRRHFANSAAMLRDSRTWYDWVRPGLALYGIVPPPLHAGDLALRPVLSLVSRIVAVKGMRAGEAAGYGRRWSPSEPRTIAVVPAGYADGLDTRLANRGSALVRGRRVPIVGSVCMDMLTIDVTGLDVSPGDEVVFIGQQERDEITAREMAAAIGAIPWEVVCRLGTRIERQYEAT
jgi:alanine racemase